METSCSGVVSTRLERMPSGREWARSSRDQKRTLRDNRVHQRVLSDFTPHIKTAACVRDFTWSPPGSGAGTSPRGAPQHHSAPSRLAAQVGPA